MSDREDIWRLDEISTQWSKLDDVHVFVLRYARPIENYLKHLLPNEDDAKEVSQSFLLQVVESGFKHADPDKGRFRHYLMRSVRNAANLFFRRQSKQRTVSVEDIDPSSLANDLTEDIWLNEWRECLLERAWKQLKSMERSHPPNHYHTTLQLVAAHPNADSTQLAERLSDAVGKPIAAPTFRKQLSRARRSLARALIREVGETLDEPSAETIRNELKTTGLWDTVSAFVS